MSGRRLPGELRVMAEQCTARGVHGVVCAAAPAAAQAGAAALREGGNAYDAAVAAALAETVLLPPKCGVGGDLIALRLAAGAAEPDTLLAIGGASAGLAQVAQRGTWRDVGPDSVGPPAAAAGYAALADLGVLGRERLAAPAIDFATDGFAWAGVCTRLSAQSAELVAEMQPDGCATYFPDGEPIAPGVIVRLPGLAEVLAEFVRRGGALMDGPVGEAVVREVRARGGVLTQGDMQHARAEWVPCVRGGVGSNVVWATPAPTYGPSLLAAASAAVAANAEHEPSDPATTYRAVLATIAEQRATLADPAGTSIVSAADTDGNVVLIVHSNSYPRFGSGIVVPEYDLVLANRAGRGFTPIEGHPNFPVEGRRPATTLHAWAVADETRAPRMIGGTPGGANQLPWNVQAIERIVAGITDPGLLVTSPLWEWLPDDDGVRIEAGFAQDQIDALLDAAPRAVSAHRWGCKSAQQVIRVPHPGEAWVAAADPRTVGLALGV